MALTHPHPELAVRPAPRDAATILRRVVMVVPPLALAVFEIIHPQPDETAVAVRDVATWFVAFHTIQLALIGLVAVSVLLLADELRYAASWTFKLGLGTFLVFFSAYDAIAGISTGYAMRDARDLSPAQQEGIWTVVKDWPGFDPFVFSINVVGTLGWVVALVALALWARDSGAPRKQWLFIAAAGVLLMGGHPFPFGTLAFGSLFVAAALVAWSDRRPSEREPAAPEPA